MIMQIMMAFMMEMLMLLMQVEYLTKIIDTLSLATGESLSVKPGSITFYTLTDMFTDTFTETFTETLSILLSLTATATATCVATR